MGKTETGVRRSLRPDSCGKANTPAARNPPPFPPSQTTKVHAEENGLVSADQSGGNRADRKEDHKVPNRTAGAKPARKPEHLRAGGSFRPGQSFPHCPARPDNSPWQATQPRGERRN